MLLDTLLDKHSLTRELFYRKGRLPKNLNWVKDAKANLITELHTQGYSWAEMCEITGLSNGSIQRLTKGKGCQAVQDKLSKIGSAVGSSWKGKSRGDQLYRQWAKGDYDSLRGRERSPEELKNIEASWTPERRAQFSQISKDRWADRSYREQLLAFHQSPEERQRRSEAQTQRMLENPDKWVRGNHEYVLTPKGTTDQVLIRSSYEKKAIKILESDDSVFSYQYEVPHKIDGQTILPDFIVTKQDHTLLIEVKPQWVLDYYNPEDKPIQRLQLAEQLATEKQWQFAIWTEKELCL